MWSSVVGSKNGKKLSQHLNIRSIKNWIRISAYYEYELSFRMSFVQSKILYIQLIQHASTHPTSILVFNLFSIMPNEFDIALLERKCLTATKIRQQQWASSERDNVREFTKQKSIWFQIPFDDDWTEFEPSRQLIPNDMSADFFFCTNITENTLKRALSLIEKEYNNTGLFDLIFTSFHSIHSDFPLLRRHW